MPVVFISQIEFFVLITNRWIFSVIQTTFSSLSFLRHKKIWIVFMKQRREGLTRKMSEIYDDSFLNKLILFLTEFYFKLWIRRLTSIQMWIFRVQWFMNCSMWHLARPFTQDKKYMNMEKLNIADMIAQKFHSIFMFQQQFFSFFAVLQKKRYLCRNC